MKHGKDGMKQKAGSAKGGGGGAACNDGTGLGSSPKTSETPWGNLEGEPKGPDQIGPSGASKSTTTGP